MALSSNNTNGSFDQSSRFQELLSTGYNMYRNLIFAHISNTVLLIVVAVVTVVSTRIMSGERLNTRRQQVLGKLTVPMMPYWIPYVGHALAFAIWPEKLFSAARKISPEGIFSLLMVGKTMNIVYTPQLIHSVFSQRPSNLEFDSITTYMIYNVFGVPSKYKNQVAKALQPLHSAIDKNLLREPQLSKVAGVTVKKLEENLPLLVGFVESPVDMAPWERPAGVRNIANQDGEPAVEANLYNLITHFIGHAAIPSIFGTDLLEAELDLLPDLFTFNNAFLLFAAGLPRWMPHPTLGAGYAARNRILDSMTRWHEALDAHVSNRPEDIPVPFSNVSDVSNLMQVRKGVYRLHGVPDHAAAALDLSILWALIANSNFLAFWILMRLLCNKSEGGDVLLTVREEVAPFVQLQRTDQSSQDLGGSSGIQEMPRVKIDAEGIVRKCPLLKAVYVESCRMDSAPWSFKQAAQDFPLPAKGREEFSTAAPNRLSPGDKPPKASYEIPKNSHVAVAFDLHFSDPEYFPEPKTFDPYRHIDSSTQTAQYGTVTPYGGGSNMCKGRLFAEREILACVAGLITLWDFESTNKDNTWKMPKPAKATAVNMAREPVVCRLKKRGW